MNNQNITQDLKELYYTQVYSEGAFGSSSMPAASADSARQAANTHRTAANAASTPEDRKRHRNAAARYEVTARRMSMTADHYEFLSDYLINENFASDLNAAHAIIESMSEEWIRSIFEENLNEVTGFGRVAFRIVADAIKRGMTSTPAVKTQLKLNQVSRNIRDLQRTGTLSQLEKAEERARRLNAVIQSPGFIRNSKIRGWWGAPPPERGYGSR